MKLPAFQFYPGDWRKDPDLSRCSKAAKGVWVDMMCLMFECEERGVLATGGLPWTNEEIAAAVGGDLTGALTCIQELLDKRVAHRNESGAVYSRRMVRDEHKRKSCGNAGKMGGGNPKFKGQGKGNSKGDVKGDSKQNTKASSSSSSSFSSSNITSSDEEGGKSKQKNFPLVLEKFLEAYEKQCGKKYVIGNYPKALSQAKGIEKKLYDPELGLGSNEDIEKAIENFFKCKDDWIVSRSYDFGIFVSQINRWVNGGKKYDASKPNNTKYDGL